MSRIGKKPILLPKGVEVVSKGGTVEIKGAKGHLSQILVKGIDIKQEGNELIITADEKIENCGKMHGLYRALINNMIKGVSEGFTKTLTLIGVGYRAALKGAKLDMQLGFSHPTELVVPQGIKVTVDEKGTTIVVSGIDKQSVGQFAAKIRELKPPEPYKGKGVRYVDEYVRKKAGKAAAKAK